MFIELDTDIEISNPDGSRTVYPADNFGFVIVPQIDTFAEKIRVDISIRNITTGKIAYVISQEDYEKEGRKGELTNKDAYEEYINIKEQLINELKTLRTNVQASRASVLEKQANTTERTNAEQALNTLEIEKGEKEAVFEVHRNNEVAPVYSIIDTFSEIRAFFPMGELSNEGLDWFKKLPFLGGVLGDYTTL